jgi:hypothetical protein
MICDFEECREPATNIGARCEQCFYSECEGIHNYCSDHYWYLRRHADHSGQIWWGEEGPCECQDCNDRFTLDDEDEGDDAFQRKMSELKERDEK